VKEVFASGETKVIEVKVPLRPKIMYYITSIKPIKNQAGEVISVICISKGHHGTQACREHAGDAAEPRCRIEHISDLNEALMSILDAATEVGDMETGGIYLVDLHTGECGSCVFEGAFAGVC
jgi:hypothetical protein